MAAFFAKSGKSKLTPFFEKLEELLKQFKEFLKKKEKSPDTPDVDKKKGTPQKKSTKSADDMTEGISKNQKKVIDDVESGKTKLEGYKGHKKGNHTRKSNYGEMKMDQKMKELGHEPLHKQIDNIDTPIQKGIDGVYKNPDPPPKYVIGEAKYDTSKLSQKAKDRPQLVNFPVFQTKKNSKFKLFYSLKKSGFTDPLVTYLFL